MKIAMWSGPRNLSTAMLYSFGARPDFEVWDEPFYAAYLHHSGIDHPLRDAVLAGHERDPDAVARAIRTQSSTEKPHLYMKHMPFHMLDGFPLDWAETCVNVHLLRHPARVVASYAAKRENPKLDDIGYAQHLTLFDRLPGPVLDSDDVRQDPEAMLQKLCAEIGLPFDPGMLHWPAGPKPWDGAWAPHWYGAVHRSTGFLGPEGDLPFLETDMAGLADRALPFYRQMARYKLTP